jgi:cytochrome c-type biogenesis protein CcmH/NrfG
VWPAVYIGDVRAAQRNYGRALESYQKAIQIAPYVEDGYIGASEALKKLQKPQEASKIMSRLNERKTQESRLGELGSRPFPLITDR